jgi:hypothetical protein
MTYREICNIKCKEGYLVFIALYLSIIPAMFVVIRETYFIDNDVVNRVKKNFFLRKNLDKSITI